MVNAQEWLDQNYPENLRSAIKYLDIESNNLEGVLDLRGFVGLKSLKCGNNQLTDVFLPSEPNLLEDLAIYPNPFINPKKNLQEWWDIYRNIPKRYNGPDDKFGHLLPDAYKLIDISDLDDWIEGYNFSWEGDQQHHRIMGKKFPGWGQRNLDSHQEDYPESVFEYYEEGGVYAIEKMSQKVLARCYIVMNRLLHGEEPTWEEEVNRLADDWVSKTLQKEFEEHTTEEERDLLPQLLETELENQTVAQQLSVTIDR